MTKSDVTLQVWPSIRNYSITTQWLLEVLGGMALYSTEYRHREACDPFFVAGRFIQRKATSDSGEEKEEGHRLLNQVNGARQGGNNDNKEGSSE